MAAYGVTNQVLTIHLTEIGIPETKIGLFMSLTLVGDTVLSYFLTWYADRIGRRLVMRLGCVMMVLSGTAFALSSNYWILLFSAIVGVISPSGDETGPFKSIEEASIAHLTPLNHRPEIYAMHWMFSTVGAAVGSLFCGFLIDGLLEADWTHQSAYRFAFFIYALIACMKFVSMLFLSDACEVHSGEEPPLLSNDDESQTSTELQDDCNTVTGLSRGTQKMLFKFLVIFMLDSFGYGFMTQAWVVYYFKTVFKFSAAALGTLYFVVNVCNSLSSLPSAYMAKAMGPVKATLAAQVPSALFYAMIPLCGTSWLPAAILLVLNAATSTMDIVPRQILLTSLMSKHELTRVLGVVNIGKTFARCIGPIFTGKLASIGLLYVNYFITGGCILLSDFILAVNFGGVDAEILQQQSVEYTI
ncbi:hypothetical protein BABINDRAFT_161557 [Babjeviella inositovora NRRL Y-12698]|uniref:Major facilitator superfamily (MFS) profile domain-containing protein n=1 Tax=Babjeviella inositovora NRRL Y-12698 TaxID=984486 RepID=A0A1E3QQW3_9ASCO|nr:uncharacterized protein BABINDRAFT_161557 [Babjeviella inositovora NRRL Y-12698]ODQ79884.1 hypothetical protein BABINDRAFT_161557 [Babjeviella inositovora NRRL Y-12698]